MNTTSFIRGLAIFLTLVLSSILSAVALAEVQTFAVIGDAGHWNSRARAARDSILNSKVKRLILPGDNIYDITKTYASIWENWTSKELELDVVAIGNHRKTFAEEVAFFKMPGQFYEKISGNVRFLVLNSDNTKNVNEQITWLKGKLAEPAPIFTLLVFHHPPATVSRFHPWTEKEDFQKQLRPLLLKHKDVINAVLVGHDHQAQLFNFGPIPVIVSGAVWEARETRATNGVMEDNIAITTHWINKSGTFYWTRLDFNDEDQTLWVNFVRTDKDEVSCSILLKRGQDILKRPNCAEVK